jgi:CHAD domain-containing protein
MTKKEERTYFDMEWKLMIFHFETFLQTGDEEGLHQFRVQVKKLRALFCLLDETAKGVGLAKVFKPVRKIFKYAGFIRDAHTSLVLSVRYQLKNENFETVQQKVIKERTTEFQLNGKEYEKKIKTSYKLLKKKLPKVDDGSIAKFYKNRLEQIAIKLSAPQFTEEMHDNRKLIKILVYNHPLAGMALNSSLHVNSGYLGKLQSAIGEWHDNAVASQLFSSTQLNDLTVMKKINKKNAAVEKNIIALIDDFMKKATTVDVIPDENIVVEL